MSDHLERQAKSVIICACMGITSALFLVQWMLSVNAAPQAPGVELGPSYTRKADAGQTILYDHTLTNTGTTTDTFLLKVWSTQDWPAELLGGSHPSGTVLLPLQAGSQMTTAFYLSLTIPLDVAGVTEVTIITATSQLSPTVWSVVKDTTIVPYKVYLPLVLKRWPPIPYDPTLNPIENVDGDGFYTVNWLITQLAQTYSLEEDDNPTFLSPTEVYSGTETSWTVPDPGKTAGMYYYRVRGLNVWGHGGYSNFEAVTVFNEYSPPIDSDHDGLSDYEETIKYLTNPYLTDTDRDGIPDGEWSERREYAYTVRVLMRIRQPFDVVTMNDWFQDVRIIDGPDQDGYTHMEAIIYPETAVDLSSSSYPLTDLPPELQIYTQPGIAANYGPSMQSEVLQILENAQTDVQAVNQVSQWVWNETTFYLDYSIPEVYYTYLEDGEVKVRNYNGSLPVEELLQTHYFADSMFELRTHGTCTSIATLKCAMLKAAGIPCRVIQTIFPIYYHEDQTVPYVNNLGREWHCVYEQASGQTPWWCNHAFLEVYLGGRWIRADWTVNIRHEDPLCLSLKILSVSDWSEVDFSETWPVDWIHSRPYYTLLLEDQEPQH
jgi:hypothetical protein